MRKLFFVFVLLITSTLMSNAQDYGTGIGFRGGLSNGLTVKHFISSENAIEGILSTRWHGFNITGLYEIHSQAFDTPGLKWYYGFGGHLGFWDGRYSPWWDDTDSYTVLGIDGIIGLEYSLADVPINVGIDWKPGLNLVGYTGFWGDELAISIRYIF